MKKRLFLYSILIIFAGLLFFFAASVYVSYNSNLDMARDRVIETTQICAGLYSNTSDLSAFVDVSGDTRITVISSDGRVLADSSPLNLNTMENHLERPEVQAAANGTPEAHIRYSASLGVDFIYYALKVEQADGYVFVRSAIPVAKIDAYFYQSLPLLIILLIVVTLLCFVLSRGMINRIIAPFSSVERRLRLLSDGEYLSAPVVGSYEEIDAIIRGIDEVAQVLQNSITDLRDEKSKMEYILNNISDGIFAVDERESIVLINSAALAVFGAALNVSGKNIIYLTNDNTLLPAIRDCAFNEKSSMFELTLKGRIYLFTIKRLPDTNLSMTIMSDVTDNRESAKQREEFFANASHELKTPLTAIKGFNELAGINNKDESINKYIETISRETDRMLLLIGDMLRLSELENTPEINPVPLSLATVVGEVYETLSASINEKSIIFELVGDGTVVAEQVHIYELVKNIIENAIRYNNQGGRVSVAIESDKKNTWLFVFDDGIGVAPEDQTRIFERFYRVEKSRSAKNGGTGLGLSIVKHLCVLYGWKLTLKSKLGVGTEISVEFNN